MFVIKWKNLLISIAIPLIVGGLSAVLTMNSMQIYAEINDPPLAPPGWLFPIVWTILFVLMGIASYIVFESDSEYKTIALTIYAIQLVINFLWTIIFFNLQNYWLSVAIIIALLILIILNMFFFNKVNRTSMLLLIPYLIWVAFATYLNIAIAVLN